MQHRPETRAPEITVVVAVFDGRDDLAACLDALDRARTGLDADLVVVDDGSRDGSGELAASRGARVLRIADGPKGPAHARNRGAELAAGTGSPLLFFTDADCLVASDTLRRALGSLRRPDAPTAVIGSYDDAPAHAGFLSRFKNLFHHWVPQGAREEASTFWTGCGAIRTGAFLELGGFNEGYDRPSIEDIELGARLKRGGHRIRLDKAMVVKHTKRWRFLDLIRTDVMRRGAPWIALMLRERESPRDLNLSLESRIASLATGLLVVSMIVLAALGRLAAIVPTAAFLAGATLATMFCRGTRPPAYRTAAGLLLALAPPVVSLALVPDPWAALPLALLVLTAYCHQGLFCVFARRQGRLFALAAVPMHLVHLLCCIAAVPTGLLRRHHDRTRLRRHGDGPGLRELPPLRPSRTSCTVEGVPA